MQSTHKSVLDLGMCAEAEDGPRQSLRRGVPSRNEEVQDLPVLLQDVLGGSC